jgi:hypothetical protein
LPPVAWQVSGQVFDRRGFAQPQIHGGILSTNSFSATPLPVISRREGTVAKGLTKLSPHL